MLVQSYLIRHDTCTIKIILFLFFFQAEDGIRDYKVTGVQTCALPILDGTLETDALSINGTTVTSTAAELNLVDGITAGKIGRASCRERV